jgi:UDP-3-O-[3-hydroxymyristoyl] N-acetylglucosamine deacetylase/3-hydroxyacyl-[acyl-carrier-protein] dehydratase
LKRNQNTVAEPIELEGVGLFGGEEVTLTMRPAEAGRGIAFVRVDMDGHPVIPCNYRHLRVHSHRSGLQHGKATVETIEHVMAALAGMRVDNVVIEMDAGEPPALDGSALPFAEAIRDAGLRELDAPKKELVVSDAISFTKGELALLALPGEDDGYTVSYTLDYNDPGVGFQSLIVKVTPESFIDQIAPARTFILRSEAEALRAGGLVKGGTPQNCLVIESDGTIVDNELRFSDEFVRHKILDLIGDLAIAGLDINGRIIAHKTGHTANARFVARILDAYERSSAVTKTAELDAVDIMKIMPHRYPMMLIDRVLEIEGEQRIVGLKNCTINEEFFQGHFPGKPVMPGVLQLDAMAQLSGVLLGRNLQQTGRIAMLLAVDKARMRRPVVPGDQLRIEIDTIRFSGRTAHVKARSTVEGEMAAEAELKFVLVDA